MNIRPVRPPVSFKVLTFDVEDWSQLIHRKLTGEMVPAGKESQTQTRHILDLLDNYQIKGTFFVLGLIAERFPALVKEIHNRGHEVASHGYAHQPLHLIGRQTVYEDIKKSIIVLEDLTGARVSGFRAPEFSITTKTPWALEMLEDLGFQYDSSIFPITHRRYGIRDFPRCPCLISFDTGRSIVELPLATALCCRKRIPVAGGGYFRLFPGYILRRLFAIIDKEKLPAVLYFHPYEFTGNDSIGTRLVNSRTHGSLHIRSFMQSGMISLTQKCGRRFVWPRLQSFLREGNFLTAREAAALVRQHQQGQTLL